MKPKIKKCICGEEIGQKCRICKKCGYNDKVSFMTLGCWIIEHGG